MKRSSGFTLIEVLIALVIIGSVAAVTVGPMTSSMRLNSDTRTRAQSLTAAEAWLDRFRAKSLSFTSFNTTQTYDYKTDYSTNTTFVDAADNDPTALNREWSNFKYAVTTVSYSTSPQIWRVTVQTFYRGSGGESSFVLSTLVRQ